MSTCTKRVGAYETLDAWRGIASLWVVLFHAASEVVGNFPAAAGDPAYRPVLLGYLGVQIFFVISGYCIANAACVSVKRSKGWWSFTLARLRRIFPPMWISLVFYAAFKIAASVAASRGMIAGDATPASDFLHQGFLYYFSNATLTQILFHQEWLSRVCWTLSYELAFYMAAAVLIIAAEGFRRTRIVLNGLHAITVLSLVGLLVAPKAMFFPFDLWPQFGLGVIAYDLIQSRAANVPRMWASVVGAMVVSFITLYQLPLGFQANPSREQFGTALAIAALLALLHRVDGTLARFAPIRWLSAIGVFSYSLYLVHLLVITVLMRLTIHKVPPGLHLAYAAALSVACVLAGWIFYWLFERRFMNVRPQPVVGLPTLEPAR